MTTHGSSAKVRDPLPQSLAPVVHALSRDALSIVPMYARLHSLGLEPPRGDSVHVSGGGVSNVPPEVAIESDHAASRREYARWVAREVRRAAKILAQVQQGLERNVGPGGGYRQPTTIGSDAIVTITELTVSIENQAARLRAGNE